MEHSTAYLNGLLFENFLWKSRYTELWNSYQNLILENTRITTLLSQFENLPSDTISEMVVEEEPDIQNEKEQYPVNLRLLQTKNRELIQKLIKTTEELNLLRRNIPNSPTNIPPKPPLIPNLPIIPPKK